MKKNDSNKYLAEAKKFLDKNPLIKSVDIVLHDVNGVGRGKIIRRHELLKLYESGRQFLYLYLEWILLVRMCRNWINFEQGDGDIKAWPISSSLKPIYNSKPPRGNFYDHVRY